MILADHTWVPVLPEWVAELNPILVTVGLAGGVLVLWQLVLSTFEPRKKWAKFRRRGKVEEGSDNG